jgi:hypothetical protein
MGVGLWCGVQSSLALEDDVAALFARPEAVQLETPERPLGHTPPVMRITLVSGPEVCAIVGVGLEYRPLCGLRWNFCRRLKHARPHHFPGRQAVGGGGSGRGWRTLHPPRSGGVTENCGKRTGRHGLCAFPIQVQLGPDSGVVREAYVWCP